MKKGIKSSAWMVLTVVCLLPEIYSQPTHHWETVVYSSDTWHYMIGSAAIEDAWKNPDYDASAWETGRGGIGYGDNDDKTGIDACLSLFMRLDFTITDTSAITSAILHADYDDGFVAYLNGVEIARANLGAPGTFPAWNEPASTNHEALMYQGGIPESFLLPSKRIDSLLLNGSNTLSIQVHNLGISSSDLSAIFYLSVGINNSNFFYRNPPSWFYAPFESSNLPVMIIETGEQSISPYQRIVANMGLMDYSSLGKRNFLTDPFNLYNGRITIKIRGSSSQNFPKKNYNLETQDDTGENLNISLLGLPEENDWVLHGPYSDKSLLRNVLSYHIAASTGRYAPRTRWLELFINGQYQGLYVLTEKIKRDDMRVDIARLRPEDISGDQLTGGYIIKIDRDDPSISDDGWYSAFKSNVFYAYHDPAQDELASEQKEYIRQYFKDFELVVMNGKDESEFIPLIDIGSFVDYWIATEIYNHIDGYKLSFYMYKDLDSKGGKLNFGPVWDLNLAYGNSDFGPEPLPSGWSWELAASGSNRPFWIIDLVKTDTVKNCIACKWQELRTGALNTDSLMNFISTNEDYIREARIRNFHRWPVLGIYVWPNYYVGATYQDEIDYLTGWLRERLAWMDQNMPGKCIQVSVENSENSLPQIATFPNPFSEYVTFSIDHISSDLRIEIFNSSGKCIKTMNVSHQSKPTFNLGYLERGMYFFRLISREGIIGTGKLIRQ